MKKYTVITIRPDFELRLYYSGFEVFQPAVQHIEAESRHAAIVCITKSGSDYVIAVFDGFVDALPVEAEAISL